MARALLLDTDFSGEIVKCDVTNGKVIIKNKDMEWEADNVQPISIKGKFGNEDFYILSWKSLIPLTFEAHENEEYLELVDDKVRATVKVLTPIKPQDYFVKTELPELSRTTFEMRFLKNMKQYAEGKGMSQRGRMVKILMIGFVIAMFVGIAFIVLSGGLA